MRKVSEYTKGFQSFYDKILEWPTPDAECNVKLNYKDKQIHGKEIIVVIEIFTFQVDYSFCFIQLILVYLFNFVNTFPL